MGRVQGLIVRFRIYSFGSLESALSALGFRARFRVSGLGFRI